MKQPQHRLERVKGLLVTGMQARIKGLAAELRGPGDRPPFSQRLTEDEMLQQYAAMDAPRWQQMIKVQGLKKTLAYSRAMLTILQRRYGINPAIIQLPDQLLQGQQAEQLRQDQPATQQPLDQDRVNAQAHEIVQSVLNQIGAPHA